MLLIEKGATVEQEVSLGVSIRAVDKKAGMTLDELAGFVQMAMRQGLPGDSKVSCWVGWRSQIQRLEVSSS